MAKKKIEVNEKKDIKFFVLSDFDLYLWWNTLEANKKHSIDKETAELLENSIFYVKWTLKIIKE